MVAIPGGRHGNGALSLLGASSSVHWRVDLHLSAPEIRKGDVMDVLLGLAKQHADLSGDIDRLYVVVSEMYNNAVEHGLLGLESSLKAQADGMEIYYAERQARLAALDSGGIDISLEQFADDESLWLRVICRDSGAGFFHAAVPQVEGGVGDELPFGRGLKLLRAMSDAFALNDAGNEATVVLRRSVSAVV